ncbi:MAG: hypothetical protein U0521_17660 [Anaerolineae bacterium]
MTFKLGYERGDAGYGNIPNDVIVNGAVGVDQAVAHPRPYRPSLAPRRLSRFLGDVIGSLANYFYRLNDGEAKQFFFLFKIVTRPTPHK